MEKILLVFPVFALLILAEFAYGLYKKRNTYLDMKDAMASLTLGITHVGMILLLASALLKIDFFIYENRLFTVETNWYTIVIMLLLTDFTYYWWHRLSHRVRFLWANHVNHHSSTKFNFTTAFRQPFFTPVLRPLFYFYLPFLGFDPQMLAVLGLAELVWAVWSHTQLIGKLGFLEYIIVTPSAHRVHHGSNPEYIDKNYGGIFIFWDILFGTYEPEVTPVKYGITKNINTYNPLKIIFHEWAAWFKDLKKSRSFRELYDVTFKPPG